ncbi:MAG: hypothetical protein O6913_08615, partial [Chloroflexi bacterium]|nr:hypothetical protein [Chloroflexota bacterium]
PDGRRVVTASDDTTARVWDAATGGNLVVLQGHSRGLRAAHFSPDGRRVVTASHDATARIWDAATGDSLATLRGHTHAVFDVAFSPDGKTIATASLDGNARLWDSASGRLHVELRGHTKKLDQVAFSPDGRFVATASHDGTARAWEVKSGTCVAVLPLAIEGQARLAFSPDGLTLAAGAGNGTTDLWDVATWKRRKTLVGHESWSQEIRFSPDSRRILTCNEDHTARLWDTATGSLLEEFSHPAAFYCGAFSPDGRRLATGGGAGELTQLWEVATGKLLLTLPDHSSWVMSVEFAPDGRRLLTASHDGTARIWELDLLSLALERAPRELTTEERVRYLDLEKATPGEQLKARRFVNRLFGELVLKADVLRQIGSDRSLSDPVRTAALRVAQGREEVDSLLNSAAWALVSRPGGTEDAYERGLRLAESAHRLAPNKLYILNTLGVAQYRTGAHEEALATLRRADAENAKLFLYARSMDLAFITMALHRLGRTEQARAALERLREQMKNPKDAADPNSRAFAAAAERLLGETSEG